MHQTAGNNKNSYGGIEVKKYNVAVVGATGMVGRPWYKVLEERNFLWGS